MITRWWGAMALSVALAPPGVSPAQPARTSAGTQPTQKPDKPLPSDEELNKLFGAKRESAWLLPDYRGPVPEPTEAAEAHLQGLAGVLQSVAGRGGRPEDLREMAGLLAAVSIVPIDEGLLQDFSSDLLLAMQDIEMMEGAAGRAIAQHLYVAVNSASLGRRELRALEESLAGVLRALGCDKNRIQTILFNIDTLNEVIKGSGLCGRK